MILRFAPALAAALLTAGCGYVSGPLPPLANVPSRVTDLTAVQRGSDIFIRFTVPNRTTEAVLIRTPLTFELRMGTAVEPFDAERWAERAVRVTDITVENLAARSQVPSSDWTGKEAIVSVRVIGRNGKASGWADYVTIPVVPPVQAPAGLRAEATGGGVHLLWSGPGDRFRVFRQDPASGRFDSAVTVQPREWIDAGAEFGKEHSYRVQAIRELGGSREAESELSEAVSIKPVDTFPPAAPAGLQAAAAPNSIELSWELNTESDFAVYRVYRAGPGSDFVRIGEDLGVPAYSDRSLESGKIYRYAVTALDRAGNESPRSAAVEVGAQ